MNVYSEQINELNELGSSCIADEPAARWELEEEDTILAEYEENLSENSQEGHRIKKLEDEQEMLSSSLLALTSHFAQVQFRLRQIVDSPINERDQLLKRLEEFAFRGIPDVNTPIVNASCTDDIIDSMKGQRRRQHDLIEHLKNQLEALEKFAYESGEPVLPQTILVEKQKVIIDELKNKINLNVEEIDLPQLSPEELRQHVDNALGEFVSPLKIKHQLVTQLKTQIVDLERFILFLQGATEDYVPIGGEDKCSCSHVIRKEHRRNSNGSPKIRKSGQKNDKKTSPRKSSNRVRIDPPEGVHSTTNNLIQRASTLLHMFVATQLGCGNSRMQRNVLKKTLKGNHWGDIRAQLEVDIQEILNLISQMGEGPFTVRSVVSKCYESEDENDDDEEEPSADTFSLTSVKLTSTVRKNFALTLQKLMQHGLRSPSETTSLVPFIGCFSNFGPASESDDDIDDDDETKTSRQMHAWELIMEYYHIKNGEKFNETPARKLSQSFNLDIVGDTVISNKQSLLSAVGSIIAIHTPYKRSFNSNFKAFVCAGLNSHKLVQWLSLIFQNSDLMNTYYASWSYASRTGFRDALKSIDRLSKHKFNLPIDLAIRQFRNIKDLFL